GRSAAPIFDRCVWEYTGPKTAGRNPGLNLACGSQRIKVKFAELHSEPFTSRIFNALGYNVDATDFVPALKVKYDRRLFLEYNSRPEMILTGGVLFIPLYRIDLQKIWDPFECIDHAVLKTGETVTKAELKRNQLNSE